MDREQALQRVEWPTRAFVANLLRVMRGAGEPHMLLNQLFDLTKILAEAHEKANPQDVSQAFRRVLDDAVPDWGMEDNNKGDLYTVMHGSLQVMASHLLGQATQQAAGRREMFEGVNNICRRREEQRRA